MTLADILEKTMPEPNTGCWIWMGSLNHGYGQQYWQGTTVKAYRLVYELSVGPIPKGLHLHHICSTRCCVNPDHILLVTPGEHIEEEMRIQGRNYKNPKWEHCSKGHEMGVYGGAWRCGVCFKERNNRRRREKRRARTDWVSKPNDLRRHGAKTNRDDPPRVGVA